MFGGFAFGQPYFGQSVSIFDRTRRIMFGAVRCLQKARRAVQLLGN